VENKLLKEAIRQMRMEKYGPKSDRLSDDQLELLEVEPGVVAAEIEIEAQCDEAAKKAVEKIRRRSHPGRNELPAHLPRVEKIIACTAEQCRCAQCGRDKKVIGYDVSEEFDVKPVEYRVLVIKREKRACGQCEEMGVSAAPLEAKIVEKGKASNAVVVDVLVKKYCDHQPLYRQCAILEREIGVELSPATLGGWVMQSGQWLEAISAAMRTQLLSGSYIQADETPVGVQSRETPGSNHRSYVWQYSRPGGPVVFDFRMGRGREGPKKFLGGFNGILQSDGYSAYDCIGGEGITHAGCMAHARRGFVDALKVAPSDRALGAIVQEIAQLYAVEKRAREIGLTPGERARLRKLRSEPLLAALKEKVVGLRKQVLPQSAAGKAANYALGQWERLIVYATRGEVEIDNNWCENAMRPIALGRKNWLHIGSEEAGPRIAAISSVLATCKRLTVNARDYLIDVLPKIPSWPANRVAELTPMAWAARQSPR
jgi:transposase